jgi:hypothetical protein
MNFISNWISPKIKKIGFEDIKIAIEHPEKYIIINTLDMKEQSCLIKTTISVQLEEKTINELIENYETKRKIIFIYGKNGIDEKPDIKYSQFVSLGFEKIFIYTGGLFEWILLQDIYGIDEFPTTEPIKDILKWKPAIRPL